MMGFENFGKEKFLARNSRKEGLICAELERRIASDRGKEIELGIPLRVYIFPFPFPFRLKTKNSYPWIQNPDSLVLA